MLDLDEIRARKKGNTADVTIVLDPEWGVRFADLQSRAAIVASDSDEAVALNVELEALRAEAAEKTATFTFKSISTDRYERLVAVHVPTAEQRADAKRQGGSLAFNPKTFPPALVAACAVEPSMTAVQAINLWEDDEWSKADLEAMFTAALGCCVFRPQVDLKA